MKEKILFALLAIGIAVIFLLSGNGFYRYKCQNPDNWTLPECQPPRCTAAKECPEDLVGDENA
jgi:hypothetical protein